MPRPRMRALVPCALICGMALALCAAWSCLPAPTMGLRPQQDLSAKDALDRLRALGLQAQPDSPGGGPAAGYWLAAPGADASPERLRGLIRQQGQADRWRGVVLMKPEQHPDDTLYAQLEEWGPSGLYAPPLVFFGDPEWIGRIKAVLAGG